MFLQVRLLKLRDFVFCMISILLSGSPELSLNTFSFLVFRFLPDEPISEQGFPPELNLSDSPSMF